jgi:hypothetical protein
MSEVNLLPNEKNGHNDSLKPAGNFFGGRKDITVSKASRKKEERKSGFLDVNFIPAELSGRNEVPFARKLVISEILIFLSVLIVGGAFLGLIWYQVIVSQRVAVIEKEIVILQQSISNREKLKGEALRTQDYLELVSQLLDRHIYWTKFFDLLEKNTIDDVFYTNFSMVGQEKLVITAVGKDYYSVGRQLLAFQQAKDFIKNVSIDAASAEIDPKSQNYDKINFTVSLEFLPEVFLKPME